jgi:hypothetical protein
VGSYGSLASTGFAVTLAGFTMGPLAMVGAAIALIAIGAIALRLGWRRNKALNSR